MYRRFFSRLSLIDKVQLTSRSGISIINDPLLNKGTAFTNEEKERLRIRGLLPCPPQPLSIQKKRILENLKECATPLAKFNFLSALQDRNETLFYSLLVEHFEELAPIVYTPTVGLACQKMHNIYRRARGMYFGIGDRGHCSAMVYNWPSDDVDIIVVTDGSRVLGLGDLGANGMHIPIGKLSLYVAGGGIRPRTVLPVVLDVGTDNQELLTNELYLGNRRTRVTGQEYYEFIDEWLEAVYNRWPNVLVQFEDFRNPYAHTLLTKYRNKYRCFNDDIQSTGTIALAGVLSSLKARGMKYEHIVNEKIVCVGAGSAGVGVCETIVECMVKEGVSREEAYKRFYLFDDKGLLGAGRDVNETCTPFLRHDLPDGMSLEDVVNIAHPSVMLGLSGARGAFTEKAVRTMAEHVERPVIFPLSNPTENSECSAEEAFDWTDGRALFASGSPFKAVVKNDKTMYPNQCNNVYSFPGIGLGVVVSQSQIVTTEMFQVAARVIADLNAAEPGSLENGVLFPKLSNLRKISHAIATRVCEVAEKDKLAGRTRGRGETWSDVVKESMWRPVYTPTVLKPQ